MNMISYRGPGKAGGLSVGLAQAWDENAVCNQQWWHILDGKLVMSTDTVSTPEEKADIDTTLADGHYRYCNEFIWPIMHDMAELAVYDNTAHQQYRDLNRLLGWQICSEEQGRLGTFFLHDYQLALLPQSLRRFADGKSAIFWHIPWPKRVPEQYARPIAELAMGLLHSDYVGFHTQEYAENFLAFVEQHIVGYDCDYGDLSVSSSAGRRLTIGGLKLSQSRSPKAARQTQLVVAPLGINMDYWSSLANMQHSWFQSGRESGTHLVLSVDRGDYSKGIINRLHGIDAFFEKYPEWLGKVTFLQICGRTRPGIEAFDNYWQECERLAVDIRKRWHHASRQSLIWQTHPISSSELSAYYRSAAVMLVTPVRDGLNLTAKEYAACQDRDPGVLVLSPGAGAFEELGQFCLAADVSNAEQLAQSIHEALIMKESERKARMRMLHKQLQQNTLLDWWKTFEQLLLEKNETETGTDPEKPLLKLTSANV